MNHQIVNWSIKNGVEYRGQLSEAFVCFLFSYDFSTNRKVIIKVHKNKSSAISSRNKVTLGSKIARPYLAPKLFQLSSNAGVYKMFFSTLSV